MTREEAKKLYSDSLAQYFKALSSSPKHAHGDESVYRRAWKEKIEGRAAPDKAQAQIE